MATSTGGVWRALAGGVATVLLLAGCSDGQVERGGDGQSRYIEGDGVVSIIPEEERDPAPAFSAPLLSGEGDFELAAAQGDIVVLNVWGSWCPPCRAEAPALQAVHEATQDSGVRFIGINTRDTEAGARSFEEEFEITYPSVDDTAGTALLAFRDTLPPAAIPSTLVIDREGRMAARVLGPIGESSLQGLIEDVDAGSSTDEPSTDEGGAPSL